MAEEPPRGSYAIKLMYVCMYFKQRFYRPVLHIFLEKRLQWLIVAYESASEDLWNCEMRLKRETKKKSFAVICNIHAIIETWTWFAGTFK